MNCTGTAWVAQPIHFVPPHGHPTAEPQNDEDIDALMAELDAPELELPVGGFSLASVGQVVSSTSSKMCISSVSQPG